MQLWLLGCHQIIKQENSMLFSCCFFEALRLRVLLGCYFQHCIHQHHLAYVCVVHGYNHSSSSTTIMASSITAGRASISAGRASGGAKGISPVKCIVVRTFQRGRFSVVRTGMGSNGILRLLRMICAQVTLHLTLTHAIAMQTERRVVTNVASPVKESWAANLHGPSERPVGTV